MHNTFDCGYYESLELRQFGFAKVGENVRIAKNCTIIGLHNIAIGDNVRIDVSCSIIATGPLILGSYIHIGAFCHLVARAGITMGDFSGLSQGVKIYTASDDYSGRNMTNPMVPEEYTGVRQAPISIGRHAIIGAGAVILPGCNIGMGSAVGALSLVTHPIPELTVAAGTPARKVSARKTGFLDKEAVFMGQRQAA